jgi:hypothetical protein
MRKWSARTYSIQPGIELTEGLGPDSFAEHVRADAVERKSSATRSSTSSRVIGPTEPALHAASSSGE